MKEKNTIVELQARIANIYNHLYANSLKKTPNGIFIEVGKILHCGMYIEVVSVKKFAFEFEPKDLKKILSDDNALHLFAEGIHGIFGKMNDEWKFYQKGDKIHLNDYDLVYTCSQLSQINLTDPTVDVFGDTIEIIRGQWAKQTGGQFFTNSYVTSLAMDLLEFDPRKGDDLVDICAGTGGFLLAGLNRIRNLIEEENGIDVEAELVRLARKSLKGQEIDNDVCSIANSSLYARLGESDSPYIQNGDSIKTDQFKKEGQIGYGKHLCAASNPPFGTKITIKDYRVLRDYELAKRSSNKDIDLFEGKSVSRPPDILFLEQNIKLLVPGSGRLSIVLPYQILSGPQTQYVREYLLRQTQILSVIDLPGETFQPHTGTKTSLITVKRRKIPLENISEVEEYKIFMSAPKWIGHDRRGNPLFKKHPTGSLTNEILTDLPEVGQAYSTYLSGGEPSKEHSSSFVISSKEIIESELIQLNALYHKPSRYNFNNGLSKKLKHWKIVPLEDLVKNIFYPPRFKRNYVEKSNGAIPFFGGADISIMNSETGKWLNPHQPKIDELKVKQNWILITRSGSTGIVSIVPKAWEGFAMSEHVIRIVPDYAKMNPYFLLAFLKSRFCQEYISKGVFGSVIDEIDPSSLAKIPVAVPKDITVLNEIIKSVQESEEARNDALSYSGRLMEKLNEALDKELGLS